MENLIRNNIQKIKSCGHQNFANFLTLFLAFFTTFFRVLINVDTVARPVNQFALLVHSRPDIDTLRLYILIALTCNFLLLIRPYPRVKPRTDD